MGGGVSIPDSLGPVVIVGAGYAGTELALIFKKAKANFTLIDSQDCFFHNVASVRAVVKESTIRQMLLPLTDVFKDRFVHGKVESIHPEDKTVKLEDGTELSYGILVIATGALVSFPGKLDFRTKEEATEIYREFHEKVKSSARIAVVGGGPVGIEIAAEIATEMKEKEVTLIHNKKRLCHPDTTDKFIKILDRQLAELGVKVVLEEKVTNLNDIPEEGPITVVTNKDSHFDTDLVIRCTGGLQPRNEAYVNTLESAVDEKGCLRVNEYFQVEGFEDIYAIGDCTNIKETKLAYVAQEQAKLLARNLSDKAKKGTMKPYIAGNIPILMGLAVGRHHGIIQLKNGMIAPEFIIRYFKCSDLMVQRYHSRFGMKVPK